MVHEKTYANRAFLYHGYGIKGFSGNGDVKGPTFSTFSSVWITLNHISAGTDYC
jgi:hypothetical protein